MAYAKYEVICDGPLISNMHLGNKPYTDEELCDGIKSGLLDSCGYPEGLEDQVTVKLIERRD